MDYSELDEAEKERRKQEAVEYRTKKHRTNLFLFCASIFSVLETVAIIFILFLLEAFVCFRVLNMDENGNLTVFSIVMIVLFFGGIVIGHIIYKIVVRAVIKKFKLQDKLSDDLINHYKTKKEILAEQNNTLSQ